MGYASAGAASFVDGYLQGKDRLRRQGIEDEEIAYRNKMRERQDALFEQQMADDAEVRRQLGGLSSAAFNAKQAVKSAERGDQTWQHQLSDREFAEKERERAAGLREAAKNQLGMEPELYDLKRKVDGDKYEDWRRSAERANQELRSKMDGMRLKQFEAELEKFNKDREAQELADIYMPAANAALISGDYSGVMDVMAKVDPNHIYDISVDGDKLFVEIRDPVIKDKAGKPKLMGEPMVFPNTRDGAAQMLGILGTAVTRNSLVAAWTVKSADDMKRREEADKEANKSARAMIASPEFYALDDDTKKLAYNRVKASISGSGSLDGRAQPAKESQLPPGLPPGSKQIGTSGGKPVYEAPDGTQYIDE